jgi:uncharacterized membrane protein YgcG
MRTLDIRTLPFSTRSFYHRCATGAVLGLLACALARAEVIRSFDVKTSLSRDAVLTVTERIVWDFENAQRRGIIREIPYRYDRNGRDYRIRIAVQSVTDESGRGYKYRVRNIGRNVNIRVGDPNVWITGAHTYVIRYTVRKAVNTFDGQPEVYWNATGNDWPVPIERASATFQPPPGVKPLRAVAFQGPYGSRDQAVTQPDGAGYRFSAANLPIGSGLTFAVRLPAGSASEPALYSVWDALKTWGVALLLPLLSLAFVLRKYAVSGRDEAWTGPAGVEWEPPKGLSPAEVGTLLDERCDMADIISTLIDLAARGYLRIEVQESTKFLFFSSKDYTFVRTEPPADAQPLAEHERRFLKGLFDGEGQPGDTVNLSDLKNEFYTHLPGIRNAIYSAVTNKNLFRGNPESVRGNYIAAGVITAIAGGIGTGVTLAAGLDWGPFAGVGLILAGLIIAFSSKAMPARTAAGVAALRQALGFQRFVRMAEKPRIEAMLKDDPTLFGRLLPFAMVLGVGDEWAEKFRDLLTEPPNWYHDPSYGYGVPFSPHSFVSDLGRGMSTMSSTFASQPSSAGSGGSGFSGGGSGGGFGGGGGGSW